MRRVNLGLGMVTLVLCGSVYAQTRSGTLAASEPRSVTPASYKAEWAGVESCDQFKRELWLLPQADSLLRPAASAGAAEKSEFESEANYQARAQRELSPYVQPDKVYLIHSLKGDWSRYNAERQELTVEFPSYTRSGYLPVRFSIDSRTTSGSTYRGANAFGVSKNIQRQRRTVLEAAYSFPREVTASPFTFSMDANDAEMFKTGIGTLHVLGQITKTYVRRGTSTPTLQRPTETSFVHYEVTMRPRCAFITFGPELVEGWGYDAW